MVSITPAMSESSNVLQPLTESSTVQKVYEYCTSYNALLKYPHQPRLGVITDLVHRIRTYKCQHDLPTLEAAYDAHRQYVLHPRASKRKRINGMAGADTAEGAKRTATEPTRESICQQRIDELESKYSALQSQYHALESRCQQRIDALERKVQPIEWQSDNRLPRRINRGFTILSELGSGQRAVVYECINRSSNTHVALKVARDPDESDVVRNDALFLHRIGWHYLIRIHGSSESLDDPTEMKHVDAIEMRLFQSTLGSDLRAFDCGRRSKRTPMWCLQQLDGLLKELAAWHAQGVVHCDIKPDNIAWSEDEQRYALIDFSHAISADDRAVVKRGTTNYTAPEALDCWTYKPIEGQRLAIRGDVWSLGLTLMYVVCREPRRPLFAVGECRSEAERRTKVLKAIKEYLRHGTDDRKKWLRQRLNIDDPALKNNVVDLLAVMLCEPDHRWEMDAVRGHKLWSLVQTKTKAEEMG